jgi:hypothetical protein
MENAGETWHSFVRDYMNNKPAPRFKHPKSGVVAASIRTVTGGSRTELFIKGTQPGGKKQVDSYKCGSPISSLENPGAPSSWLAAVNSWAGRGVGSSSQWGSVKTRGSGCFLAPALPKKDDEKKKSKKSDDDDGEQPAPTCQPGFVDKPKGCVIPS